MAVLIVVSLTAVVIAPPTLSSQDILKWARLDTPAAGLGLADPWPWVVFLALDFTAATCVLVSLFCAMRDEPAGLFGLGVWAFAALTAVANYQFNNVAGAPGSGRWFFPIMSVAGPVLLHATLKKIRNWTREAAGATRRRRPKFATADWFPLVGTPQATFGAWRIGGMLGVHLPDDALFVYRALTVGRGWCRRWLVNGVVRANLDAALNLTLDAQDGGLHPRLRALLVPDPDGTPDTQDVPRPVSHDPLAEIEADLLRDTGHGTSRIGTRPTPGDGTRDAASRVPSPGAMGHGTPQDGTSRVPSAADTGRRTQDAGHGTRDTGPVTMGHPPATNGTPDRPTRYAVHGTDPRDGDGTQDTASLDPDLLRYASHIIKIAEARPDWQTDPPSVREAAKILGFTSLSVAGPVMKAMRRLAGEPDAHTSVEDLRRTTTSESEGEGK